MEEHRYLRAKQVLEIIPVCRTTLWDWNRKGLFPRPVKIGGTVLWHERDVLKWVEDQRAQQANDKRAKWREGV